ncbi:WD40 repeat-like protein [Serendipita vermifera]|nr:WD40 repeat-like protein [Serendipita vermifera]
MGDFEDEWDDEVDDDENAVVDESKSDDEDGMDVDVQPAPEDEDQDPKSDQKIKTFIPGRHVLSNGEILEPDQSAYEMLHRMNVAWPCLSFDVLRDGLGEERRKYPATAFVVTGTQADQAKNNEIIVMKMGSLHKTQNDDGNSDSDEEEDEGDLDEDAVLEHRSISHFGGINRIRAQPFPSTLTHQPPTSQPYHIATWAETGKVNIYDIRPHLQSFESGTPLPSSTSTKPLHSISNHGKMEGFAMDWATSLHPSTGAVSGLRLLTGDIASKIYLTMSTKTGFTTSSNPFTSHTSSIEDLQWSPSEGTVFASCSADRSIRIWDARTKEKKSVMAVEAAHESDVNVISWNKVASAAHLIVSGGDEGNLRVWDLRSLTMGNQKRSPVASFNWHKAPITSVEWHPTDESAFVASGADDQITIWDLSVEEDDEEMGASSQEPAMKDVPSQLLFVHQGQKDIKEVHWHPQIPGAVISTARDGFNIFKTISI